MATDKRKRVVFIRRDYLHELEAEARRRKWPLSRVVQLAVRLAMPKLRQMRGAHGHVTSHRKAHDSHERDHHRHVGP